MQAQLKNVDLNLLTLFIAVMEERSISKAAVKLTMSQPAASLALNRLRSTFKDDLFVRGGGQMQPTQLAKSLYPPMYKALMLIGQSLPQSVFDPQQSQHKFTIAASDTIQSQIFAKLFSAIRQQASSIKLETEHFLSSPLVDSLLYQQADLFFDYQPGKAKELVSHPLYHDTPVLIASQSHANLALFRETWQKLQYVQLKDPVSGLNPFQQLTPQGLVTESLCIQVNSLSALFAMIEDSDLVAILPRKLVSNSTSKLN